jgi:hypothetical protein
MQRRGYSQEKLAFDVTRTAGNAFALTLVGELQTTCVTDVES